MHLGVDQDDRTIGRALRDAWGVNRCEPCPVPPERAVAAVAELRSLGARLAADGTLPLTWPSRATTRSTRRSIPFDTKMDHPSGSW